MLIPLTAGVMGNIVSFAIMVPKELIPQRMQACAQERSWEVLVKIFEKDCFRIVCWLICYIVEEFVFWGFKFLVVRGV